MLSWDLVVWGLGGFASSFFGLIKGSIGAFGAALIFLIGSFEGFEKENSSHFSYYRLIH